MFLALVALGTLALFAYRYYATKNRYWADRRVPGPDPELLYGNLRAVWDYKRPRGLVLREWTKQYGKVYGYFDGQRPILVLSDAQLINEIFVKRFDCFNATAKLGLQGPPNGENVHMAQASGAQWKRLRTLSTDAFSSKAIRNVFPTIKESAKQIVQFMNEQDGKEIDAQRYFREYTMDIISKLTLGMDDCRMFENELVEWCSKFFIAPIFPWLFSLSAIFPFLIPFLRIFIFASILFIKLPVFTLTRHIRKTVEERKQQLDAGEPAKSDIIGMFLEAESDEVGAGVKASDIVFATRSKNKLSVNEIVASCKLFLLAGYDTTSITLSKAAHFLANLPEIQERLKEEIDDVIVDEDYDLEDIANLRYAEAVIKETLRLHPLASGFTSRECTTACSIGPHSFNVGDAIFVDVFSLQLDKELWGEDAEEFRPDRWLNDTAKDRTAFLAFGAGPRICLGMKLAVAEAKVALVEILRKFTIEKTENTDPLKIFGSFIVSFEHVHLKMRKRE